MPSPTESVLAMFLMSMTNFGDYYGAFERTEHEFEAKVTNMMTFKHFNNNNNNNKLQLGCHPVAVVFFYMYTKYEIGY